METLTTDEFESLKSQPAVTVVDVLQTSHFDNEHIPGAINIPLDHIAVEALEQFDETDRIVVYCASESCQASPKAAEKLEKLGFQNVYDYEGGLADWKESGHETE